MKSPETGDPGGAGLPWCAPCFGPSAQRRHGGGPEAMCVAKGRGDAQREAWEAVPHNI